MIENYDNEPPWDTLIRWIREEIYRQYQPTIRRIPYGPHGDHTLNYDIEFTWQNTFRYEGAMYNVVAHLHVRDGNAINDGGAWVTGLHDSGIHWRQYDYHNYFYDYMRYYME